MSVRLSFTTGFDAIIRKKRLASLLDIKAYLESLHDKTAFNEQDFGVLESIGNELQSFYASTSSMAEQGVIESLLKQLKASISVLRVKNRQGSINSLTKVLAGLHTLMSKIITNELNKMNTSVSVMVKTTESK